MAATGNTGGVFTGRGDGTFNPGLLGGVLPPGGELSGQILAGREGASDPDVTKHRMDSRYAVTR